MGVGDGAGETGGEGEGDGQAIGEADDYIADALAGFEVPFLMERDAGQVMHCGSVSQASGWNHADLGCGNGAGKLFGASRPFTRGPRLY